MSTAVCSSGQGIWGRWHPRYAQHPATVMEVARKTQPAKPACSWWAPGSSSADTVSTTMGGWTRKATILVVWAGEGKPSLGAPPGTERSRDTGVHPPCVTLRAAPRSQCILSPPRVEEQTSRLLPKHLKKQCCLTHPAVSHSPGQQPAAQPLPPRPHRELPGGHFAETRQKHTGRSFSSPAISRSLSRSSTARFRTPEGSVLVSSFQQPHLVTGLQRALHGGCTETSKAEDRHWPLPPAFWHA